MVLKNGGMAYINSDLHLHKTLTFALNIKIENGYVNHI